MAVGSGVVVTGGVVVVVGGVVPPLQAERMNTITTRQIVNSQLVR